MNLKELQQLIAFISRSDFTRFEMENEGFKLKLARGQGDRLRTTLAEPSAVTSGPDPEPLPPEQAAAPPGPLAGEELHEVKSPIVGTFYRASNPEADPFVETGSIVKRGQPLCIVEAMKLMNEIESDVEGEVVEILVANGQPVEYGEVLFRLRPIAA